MKLILIRHGETHANVLFNTDEAMLIGAWEDEMTRLNDNGVTQALKTKERLLNIPVDRVYASDLTRAQQTAAIIFPHHEIILDSRLRERSHGSLEGKKVSLIQNDPVESQWMVDASKDSFEEILSKKVPDGECLNDVALRLKSFLSTLDFEAEETVAIVSHFHCMRVMTELLENGAISEKINTRFIPNAAPLFYLYQNDHFIAVESFD